MTHLDRLKIAASEYWNPPDVREAIAWAVERIAELEALMLQYAPSRLTITTAPSPAPIVGPLELPTVHC